MAKIWKVDLPGPLPDGLAEVLRAGAGQMIVTVPESWCYLVCRQAPPGGWTRRLREELRPGLFPEGTGALLWDEEIHQDGTWEVWAVSQARIDSLLPQWQAAKGIRGRICTKRQQTKDGALSAFPNLAPLRARPRRWPWHAIKRVARWGIGPLLGMVMLGWGWGRQYREWQWIRQEVLNTRARVDRIQGELSREKTLMKFLDPNLSQGPTPFLSDLDALTRLISEDSYGIELWWHHDSIRLNLITPKPEMVREALEASPEFQAVHFEGNLERRGELSRLMLSMRPEASR